MSDPRQHLHELIDSVPSAQIPAIEGFLQAVLNEELSNEDRRAIAAARAYFDAGGEGISFEQVIAECGFTMDEIRGHHDRFFEQDAKTAHA